MCTVGQFALQDISSTDATEDKSECDDDKVLPTSNVSTATNAEDQPVQTKPPVEKKRSKKSTIMKEEESTLKVISSTLRAVAEDHKQHSTERSTRSGDDDCDVYGKYVAGELRSTTDQYNRHVAKRRISDVLFHAKWQRVNNNR